MANLKAILRACNAMPVGKRYKIMFGECETDAEFVKKLKKLLVAVGMTGERGREGRHKLTFCHKLKLLFPHNI